jgi:hypothetical protein
LEPIHVIPSESKRLRYRHRPKDAFLQLSNDLAVKLRIPFLLVKSPEKDYARLFSERVQRAAEVLSAQNPQALLVIAIDAADNSVTAAEKLVPPERSFVADFVGLGSVANNVRLVVTARTGRLDRLRLPSRFVEFPINGFTEPETTAFVARKWKIVPDSWIEDFHHFTKGTPRVQNYAVEYGGGDLRRTLEFVLPHGKNIDEIFENRLNETLTKRGEQDAIDRFCTALIWLPRPIPLNALSVIAHLNVDDLRDICIDLAPGILLDSDRMGFADEDFENFIRNRAKAHEDVVERFAQWCLDHRLTDPYAAGHVAAALYSAGRGMEVIVLLEQETEPAAIADPMVRRQVQLQRMRVAMKVSTEQGSAVESLRTILAGAEALKTDAAIRKLVIENPDMSATFMRDSVVQLVLLDPEQIENHGPLLFQLALEDARAGNAVATRQDLRQLSAWFERRKQDYEQKQRDNPNSYVSDNAWPLDADDVAAEIEAILLTDGIKPALLALAGWRPREISLRVARVLIPRLLASGHAAVLEQCLAEKLIPSPWSLFLLVPLAVSGRDVDLNEVSNGLVGLHRRRLLRLEHLKEDFSGRDEFASFIHDTALTGCEIVISRGGDRERIRPVLAALGDDRYRRVDNLSGFRPALADVLLRAFTLLQFVNGATATLESFVSDLNASPTGTPGAEQDSRWREKTQEVNDLIGTVLPLYIARAKLISGDVPLAQAGGSLTEAVRAFAHSQYRSSRIHGASYLRKRAAIALSTLQLVLNIDAKAVMSACTAIFGERSYPLGRDDIATLSSLRMSALLHDPILRYIADRSSAVRKLKTVASDKVEMILHLARFVDPISRSDAGALFVAAHELTEEIDVDSVYQLKAASSLGIRGVSSMDKLQRRASARDFHTFVTDAAIRLQEQEHFPWKDTIALLCSLDLPTSLAAVARWQDSAIVNFEIALPSLLRTGLADGTLSPEEATALLTLLDSPDLDVLAAITGKLPKDSRSIAARNTIARDELLRFGAGDRIDVLPLLEMHSKGHDGVWVEHLRQTTRFRSLGTQVENRRDDRDTNSAESAVAPERTALGTSAEISQFIQSALRKTSSGQTRISPQEVFADAAKRIPVALTIDYLEAICALPGEVASANVLVNAIRDAVINNAKLPSVQEWCRNRLPNVIVEHFPAFSAWLPFRGSPLPELLGLMETNTATKTLVQGIATHVDDLQATEVYAIVQLLASRMNPSEAAIRQVARKISAQASRTRMGRGNQIRVGNSSLAMSDSAGNRQMSQLRLRPMPGRPLASGGSWRWRLTAYRRHPTSEAGDVTTKGDTSAHCTL